MKRYQLLLPADALADDGDIETVRAETRRHGFIPGAIGYGQIEGKAMAGINLLATNGHHNEATLLMTLRGGNLPCGFVDAALHRTPRIEIATPLPGLSDTQLRFHCDSEVEGRGRGDVCCLISSHGFDTRDLRTVVTDGGRSVVVLDLKPETVLSDSLIEEYERRFAKP